MRLVFYALLTIVGTIAAAAAFVYAALPTDFVRDELAAQVLTRTGRTLTVTGPVSISLYPEPSVELADVALSPPAGMSGEPALAIHALKLKVALWPLLRHQLSIDGFTLDRPVIVLKTGADGRRSWDLRKDAGSQPQLRNGVSADPAAAASSTAPDPAAPRRIAGLSGLQLHNVHIFSGTIRLIDERTGLNETLSDVSLDLALDAIDGPVRLAGALTWSGEPTAFQGSAGPAANLMTGDPVTLDLTISGRLAKATVKANYAQSAQTPLGGHVEMTAGSLRDLLRWLRQQLPAGPGFGPMSIAADFGLSSDGVAARNANLVLDGGTAKGDFSITRGKARLMLRANLTLDRLDLNSYLAGGDGKPAAAGAIVSSETPATTNSGSQPETAKPVRAAASGWSDDPIDLSVLRKADADVTLALGAIRWRAINAGHTALRVGLKDGVMKTRLSEIELYGGKGSGSVTLDGAGPTAKLETNFALHGIQVQPFLNDAAGFNQVAGRGDVSFGLAGAGRSQREIVKVLMGQGRMEIGDGAIVGFNVAQGIRGLQNGQFAGWQDQPSAKTDFSAMTASCTINSGVLDNRDLVVTSPVLRLTGAGTANLPDRTLDYTAQSSLADSTDGQAATDAGGQDAAALTIPVRITGPWAKPAVTLDLNSIAKNPQAAVDTLKKVVGKFAGSKQGKALGDLLGGLLGKVTKQSDPAADQAPQQ